MKWGGAAFIGGGALYTAAPAATPLAHAHWKL